MQKPYTMISQDGLIQLLKTLIALPKECEWVEFKHNNANPEEIGEYLSALSNSAYLLQRYEKKTKCVAFRFFFRRGVLHTPPRVIVANARTGKHFLYFITTTVIPSPPRSICS